MRRLDQFVVCESKHLGFMWMSTPLMSARVDGRPHLVIKYGNVCDIVWTNSFSQLSCCLGLISIPRSAMVGYRSLSARRFIPIFAPNSTQESSAPARRSADEKK